jgi:hypothetical protein
MDDKTVDNAVEAVKSGSQAFEHITDIFNKLAGPLASEVGMMLGDKARAYRMRNWLRCERRICEMLGEAELEPHEIPPRQFLPMVEAASLEDDATLQELWAALIANTATSVRETPSAFITFLEELSPSEATFLNAFWERTNLLLIEHIEGEGRHVGGAAPAHIPGSSLDTCPTCGSPDRQLRKGIAPSTAGHAMSCQNAWLYRQCAIFSEGEVTTMLHDARELCKGGSDAYVALTNLLRLGILEKISRGERLTYENDPRSKPPAKMVPTSEVRYCFTPLGWLFVNSCQSPTRMNKLLLLW